MNELDPDLAENIGALKTIIATGKSGDQEVEAKRMQEAGDLALDLVADAFMSLRRHADALERIADVMERRHGAA